MRRNQLKPWYTGPAHHDTFSIATPTRTHTHTRARAQTHTHTHTRARAHKRTQTHARTTDARRRTHLGVVGVVGVIGVRLFVCAAALRALLLHAWALNDRRLAHHNKHT